MTLSTAHLDQLPPSVRRPAYDRRSLTKSIVHIGVGGFHRAHQAVYLDDLLHLPGFTGWGLLEVCLLPRDRRMYDVLKGQDCLYTLVTRDKTQGDTARVIGSIADVLYAPGDPEAVLEAMASPECRIVSMTITEGGYYVHHGTGRFDDTHPDIVRDLADPHHPACVFGYLAESLQRRRARGLPPFTAQSCDNLQNNGEVLKTMFLAFCERRGRSLAAWVREHGAFPNSMVDRITPATTPEHVQMVKDKFDIEDGWPVVAESFLQWVVEDHFCQGRPEWEKAGAQLVADVLPYEKMKLRLLNASHQALCYTGMLVGLEFAHQTMEDPRIRTIVRRLMDEEVTPLLPPVPGIDVEVYKNTLIERFANPAIRDQLSRIGTEGSARIAKFVLPSVVDQLARGGPVRLLAFVVASWFRYLAGTDDHGRTLPMNEPMAEPLCRLAKSAGADPRPLLGVHEVFSRDVAASPAFAAAVTEALGSYYTRGAEATLDAYAKR